MANSPSINYIPQFESAPGVLASGYWLKAYEPGAVSTPVTIYTDASTSTPLTKAELNALGQPVTSGNTPFCPHFAVTHDAWLFPTEAEADANDNSRAIQVIDAGILIPSLTEVAKIHDTVATMKADTTLVVGNVVRTIEHTAGYGYEGWNFYLGIAVTGGTDDNGSRIKSTGNPSLEFIALFPTIPNAKQFGCAGDGSTNDETALENFLSYLGSGSYSGTITGPRAGFLPAGKYLYTTTKTLPATTTLTGVAYDSVLLPSSAVTTAFVQGNGSTLEKVVIDGINTTNTSCVGLSIGESGLVNNGFTRSVLVVRFDTTSSIGASIQFSVIWRFDDCDFSDNHFGVKTSYAAGSGGVPTTQVFTNCVFKSNESYGLFITTGQEMQFYGCVFELNGDEGIYLNAASGTGTTANLMNITFDAPYFEANHQNTTQGAARHAKYNVVVRGTNVTFRKPFVSAGTSEAKFVDFDNCVSCTVNNPGIRPATNDVIKLQNNSTVTIVDWPSDSGGYDGSIDIVAGTVKFLDILTGTFSPAVTFVTPGNLSIAYTAQIGRWMRIGNRVMVQITIQTSTFTHTTASGNLQITGLPYTSANITNGSFDGSLVWGGITKASYTDISLTILANTNVITLTACGSGQAATSITASDTPTAGTLVLQGQITYEI